MKTNFWRTSPGGDAEFWVDCSSGDFIALELGFFLVRLDKRERKEILNLTNQEEFVERYKDKFKDKEADAKQFWHFIHDMKKNDVIIANKGVEKIIGVGLINSDVYIEEREYFPIRRKVLWILKDTDIPIPSLLKTKFENVVEKLTAEDIQYLKIRYYVENRLTQIQNFLKLIP